MSEEPAGPRLSERLYAVLQAADDAGRAMAERLDMGVSDTAALQHLFTHGPAGPAELGRALGLGSGAATMLADRLERAGHVERRPHPDDRRRRTLVPTEQAERAAGEVLGPLVAGLDAVEDGLDGGARAAVADYLAAVLDAYRRYCGAVTPPASGG
jgi:DNA-binding MarR family transcriptional regulator